jgi:hypothetical protein
MATHTSSLGTDAIAIPDDQSEQDDIEAEQHEEGNSPIPPDRERKGDR